MQERGIKFSGLCIWRMQNSSWNFLRYAASSPSPPWRSKVQTSQYKYLFSNWSPNKQSAFSLGNKWGLWSLQSLNYILQNSFISKLRTEYSQWKTGLCHIQECELITGLDLLVGPLVKILVSQFLSSLDGNENQPFRIWSWLHFCHLNVSSVGKTESKLHGQKASISCLPQIILQIDDIHVSLMLGCLTGLWTGLALFRHSSDSPYKIW